MRGEFVEVGDYRLYYYAAGIRGAGEPIILVHGFPTSSHLWSNLVSLLPAGHRIVVPDLLGFGRSDIAEHADLSIEGHASRLVGLMGALGITRGCMVGHHFGASVAATVAAKNPRLVTRLALLHPLGGDVTLTGTFAVMRAFLPLVRVTPMSMWSAPIRAELSRWFSDPLRARPSVDQYLGQWRKSTHWKQLLRQLAALKAQDMVECTRRLAHLDLPVTIVTSDDDPAVPRVALEQVLQELPRATLDIIKDVRHFSPEESPERIAAVVARLLRS
jgi:pimeloyl-ACP methyl ester carboxylesterase